MDICFDKWMELNHSGIEFCRYADDVIVHCVTEKQALYMLSVIEKRMNKCGIELNSNKTKIAKTKDVKAEFVNEVSFDFLGFTYKPTKRMNRKTQLCFRSFEPTISSKSKVKINEKLKKSKVFTYTQLDIREIAEIINVKIRGWFNYYGYFDKWSMFSICRLIDNKLAKCMKKKYKLRIHADGYLLVKKIKKEQPRMFYHWELLSY